MTRSLLLVGDIGSPYTRKMRALLRFRRTPHQFIEWNTSETEGLPEPPLPLMPCLYLPKGEAGWTPLSDSTFQLRRLEERQGERSVIPRDPALAFLDSLVEDFADEWVTKPMFHYRWGIPENAENASKMLPLWRLTVPDSFVDEFGKTFARRQIDRLSGVVMGSLEVCGPVVEASYARLLQILQAIFRERRFLLGSRPGAGDFGLHGQLCQLTQVEPTSAAQCRRDAPRVAAWVDVVEDLSGIRVDGDAGWIERDALGSEFRELLCEVGRTYAPFLRANAHAIDAGEAETHCTIDGAKYWQRAFPYQRKCFLWLQAEYEKLPGEDRAFVDETLRGTGCEVLLQPL